MQFRNYLLFSILFFATSVIGQKNSCNNSKAYLGINYDMVSSDKASLLGFDNPYGDYITKVIKNTPADKAGLEVFDYIYGVNDEKVSSDRKLGKMLNNYKPGDKIAIHYYRKGKSFSADVVLGDRSSSYGKCTSSNAFLGVSQHSEYNGRTKGVKVNIISNSTAAALGLQKGDVIESINGYPMINWTDITTAISATVAGENIVIAYTRNGISNRAAMPIKSVREGRNYTYNYTNKYKHKNKKERAFLGINYDDISMEKAQKLGFDNPYGTYISTVYTNTAADRAGLKPFDYFYGIDEYVFDKERGIGEIMRKFKPADKVTFLVLRDGKKMKLQATLGKKSDKKNTCKDKCKKAFLGISPSNKHIKDRGVEVDVVSYSTAKELGLKNGAIINSINGHRIIDWSDIATAINDLNAGDKINIIYYQNGTKENASGKIKSYCDRKKDYRQSCSENYGKEVEKWAQVTTPTHIEEGEPIDINHVDLILSDLTSAEVGRMDYQASSNNLRVDFLNITPDPQSGKFLLEFNVPTSGLLKVRFHNDAGREIYSYQMDDFVGHFSDAINISQNGTGNYFMEIIHNNRHISKKITLIAM